MARPEIILILHNIRSRFNVGAIFRTADAAGVKKIILCGITPAPPHPKIDKVALGAELSIPFEKVHSASRALRTVSKLKYYTIALEQSSRSKPYFSLAKKEKVAVLVGNEVSGLPKQLLEKCRTVVEIPMYGQKESLNVAVATGILIFDMIRSR